MERFFSELFHRFFKDYRTGIKKAYVQGYEDGKAEAKQKGLSGSYLTVKQVAEQLHVRPTLISTWIAEGLQSYRLREGSSVRYLRTVEVDAWIQENKAA